MADQGFLTVEEAARALGVTARHVQRLAENEEISKVARGLVDRSSVERSLAAQRQGRTRSWAEDTAWGAVAELAGRVPAWLGDAQASRLRRALRETADADELDGVVSSLGLRPGAGGHVVLRATAFDVAVVTDLVRTPVVAALDAATSTDPCVRGVGHRALSDVVRSYR